MNTTSILRVNRFMRFFESIEKHLRLADKGSVATTLEIVKARNSNGWTRGGRGSDEIRMGPSIPKDWYWNPQFSKVNPSTMDVKERADYYTAYGKVFSKMSHENRNRGLNFVCKNSPL